MFAPQPNRPLRQTLLLSTIVIGVTMLGAVILYAVTEWLWLVVHQGLRGGSSSERTALPSPLVCRITSNFFIVHAANRGKCGKRCGERHAQGCLVAWDVGAD